ncbi:VC0807 family protein [Saccharopolyspora taberi]|uniref:Intracellular septation protein A n=1 Tax=Saccharopolyspora taberi TaxID=60895 RepID=A0ABN3V2V5_9PSEU
MILALLLDLVLPVAVYYGLRSAGVGEVPALVTSAVVPVVRIAHELLVHRRADPLAVFALVMIAVSLLLSYVGGSPRTLLARDGWLMAACGVAVLATLRRRPVVFTLGRMLVARAGHGVEDWDRRWSGSAPFRRVWRVLTAAWGIALLGAAAVKVLMAYSLPVDVVPALTTAMWLAVVVLLNVASRLYLRLPRIRRIVG